MPATAMLAVVLVAGIAVVARPATQDAAAPAPAGRITFTEAWTATIDGRLPFHLAAGEDLVLLTGPDLDATARSVADGAIRWTAAARGVVTPASGDGLFLVSEPTRLLALQAASGAVRWTIDTTAPALASWTSGWFLVAWERELRGFRTRDPQPGWRLPLDEAVRRGPAIDGGTAIVALENRHLIAVDVESGRLRWSRTLPADPIALRAAHGGVFFGTADGTCYALRLSDGRVSWRYPLRVEAIGAPAVDDRHVYVALYDNTVRAFDRGVGNARWSRPLDGRPAAGPLAAGASLVVPLTSGTLQVVSAADGGSPSPIGSPPPADAILQAAVSDRAGHWVAAVTSTLFDLTLRLWRRDASPTR